MGIHMKKHVRRNKCQAGFSLVELVLALAVSAVALTSVVGLIPLGLQSLRDSIELNVEAAITQRVASLAAQSEFSELQRLEGDLLFDDQGSLVKNEDRAIYRAVVLRPARVSDLSGENWPMASENLKRMVVEIQTVDGRPIKAFTLHVGNNGNVPR